MKLPKLFDAEIQKKMLYGFLKQDSSILHLANFFEADVIPRADKRGEPLLDYLMWAMNNLEEIVGLTRQFDGIMDERERRTQIRAYIDALHGDDTSDAEWGPVEHVQSGLYVLTYFAAMFKDYPTDDYVPE